VDGNWASRLRCRGCDKSAPQRVVTAAKKAASEAKPSAASDRSRDRGATPSNSSLEKFKKELLAEVRGALKASAPPKPAAATAAPSSDAGAEDNGGEAARAKLVEEIEGLKKILDASHPEVQKRQEELDGLRRKRPLHTQVLDAQRKVEKAGKKFESKRKELDGLDKQIEELRKLQQAASDSVLEAKQELDTAKERQHEVLQAMAKNGDPPSDQLDQTKEAIEMLGKAGSADDLEARQLLIAAKAKLAEVEKKLCPASTWEDARSESTSQAGDIDMASAFAEFADDFLADVETIADIPGGDRELARTKLQKRLGESAWKLVRKRGKIA
jgi:chromosome segregation ATPase